MEIDSNFYVSTYFYLSINFSVFFIATYTIILSAKSRFSRLENVASHSLQWSKLKKCNTKDVYYKTIYTNRKQYSKKRNQLLSDPSLLALKICTPRKHLQFEQARPREERETRKTCDTDVKNTNHSI